MGKVNSYISNNCFLVEPKIKKIRSCQFVTNLKKKNKGVVASVQQIKYMKKMGSCKCATNEIYKKWVFASVQQMN